VRHPHQEHQSAQDVGIPQASEPEMLLLGFSVLLQRPLHFGQQGLMADVGDGGLIM
jgi:hypothetical protein